MSHEDRVEQLHRTGIELYLRCEKWRKALEKINKLTDDPMIIGLIQRTLKGE